MVSICPLLLTFPYQPITKSFEIENTHTKPSWCTLWKWLLNSTDESNPTIPPTSANLQKHRGTWTGFLPSILPPTPSGRFRLQWPTLPIQPARDSVLMFESDNEILHNLHPVLCNSNGLLLHGLPLIQGDAQKPFSLLDLALGPQVSLLPWLKSEAAFWDPFGNVETTACWGKPMRIPRILGCFTFKELCAWLSWRSKMQFS